jgi:hypothetical protein
MVQKLKSAALTAVVLAVGFVGATFHSRTVQAHDGCHRVHGRYHADVTTAGCTSPVGLCATGTITHGGFLDSSSIFVALDIAPFAGMPATEPAGNVSYSGTITINAHGGMLQVRDLGVVDSIHGGNFTEIERPASGTGIFTNASHDFFISGSLTNNQNTFDGEISGELCGLGDGDGDGDDH